MVQMKGDKDYVVLNVKEVVVPVKPESIERINIWTLPGKIMKLITTCILVINLITTAVTYLNTEEVLDHVEGYMKTNCHINNGGCDRHALCNITGKGYRECICDKGFTGNGVHCEDINECQAMNETCHMNATCTNTIGSRICECKKGFIGDGVTCHVPNECHFNHGGCHQHAICVNTIGSRQCKCKEGFVGDGFNCTDINECEVENGGCHEKATCNNTNGGHACECMTGYNGDGFNCTGVPHYYITKTKCLDGCNGVGGRCPYCGMNGYCCRRGWSDCSEDKSKFASPSDHVCISSFSFT